jgi:predicted metal-dependent phosphotriesterase family hydrolase
LQDFFEKLWAAGITESELTLMAATNPARMLCL